MEATVLTGRRPRVIGRNSRRHGHGQEAQDPIVRLHTSAGVAGWGWSRASQGDAQGLVGKRLHEVFDDATGTADAFLMFDFPLWDLAARLLGKPVHSMLGDAGPEPVPVYDGSIYIDELDPDTGRDDGVQPMLNAVRMGLDAGFRAFKVKVGRGHMWMERRAGLRRDVDVLHAIRELIGPDMRLLIDANNGYTPAEARQVMHEAGDTDIFWFEEPFPEDKTECVAFKGFIQDGGWQTLVADGEGSEDRDAELTEIVRAGGIDVVQLDLRRYTLTKWLRYMPVLADTGTLSAPHNWGSHLSGFYIPQLARGCGRFAMGETDIMAMPDVSAEGYELANGMRSVPESPGFGLEIDAGSFERGRQRGDAWDVRGMH